MPRKMWMRGTVSRNVQRRRRRRGSRKVARRRMMRRRSSRKVGSKEDQVGKWQGGGE